MSNQQYWQSQRYEFFLTKFFRWYFCFLDTLLGGDNFPNLYAPSRDAIPNIGQLWEQVWKHDFVMERVWPWWWFSVPDFQDKTISHLKKIEKINRIKRGGLLWFPFSMTMSIAILLLGVPTSLVVLLTYVFLVWFINRLSTSPISTIWILVSLWSGYAFYEWRQLLGEIESIPDFGLNYSGHNLLRDWDNQPSEDSFRRRLQFESPWWGALLYALFVPILPIVIPIASIGFGFLEALDKERIRYFFEGIEFAFGCVGDLFKTLFFIGFSNGPLEHFQRLYLAQQAHPPIQALMRTRRDAVWPRRYGFDFKNDMQPFLKQINDEIDIHFRVRSEIGSMIDELLSTNRLNQQDLNGIYWNESRAVAFTQIHHVNQEMEAEVATALQGLEDLGVDIHLDGVPYSPYLLEELEKLKASSDATVSWQRRANKFAIELDPIEVVVSATLEPDGDSVNMVMTSGGGEASAQIKEQYRMVLINEECAYIKQNLWEGIEWSESLEQACLQYVREDCQSVSTTHVSNDRLTDFDGVLSEFETTDWWSMGKTSSAETPLSDAIFELDYQLDPTEVLESGLGWMIAEKDEWIREPKIIEQLQSSFQGIVPPVCTRNGLNIGYHADFVSSYTDAVHRFYQSQKLRERYRVLGEDPLQDSDRWYGATETIAEHTLSV